MNTEQVLTRLKLDPISPNTAVQQVRVQIEGSPNPLGAARILFSNFTAPDEEFNFTDANEARLVVAFLVENAIKLGEQYDPNDALKRAAKWLVNHKMERPWSFAKAETSVSVSTETQLREGVNIEVKADGKLKKGSKQILAKALFDKDPSLSNADMIKLFVKELNMSEAGARTYVYNCRKGAKSK